MQTEPEFLKGGGECGAITRSVDWAVTPLGSVAGWPSALRITLSTVLHSGFPMLLFWGPKHICFYNDAYRPSLGNEGKHPDAIGKPAEVVWPETWHIMEPNFRKILSTGEAQWNEDRYLPIYRNGKLENVYWTYSTSAVKNDEGQIEGLLVVCTETTSKVLNQKKLEENNEWLQMALDAAEMGTWDLNLATNTIQASELTKKLFGLPPDKEADLMLALNNVLEGDRNRVVEAIKRAIYQGEKYDVNYTVVIQDGLERMVNAKGKLYYTSDGSANRFAGIVQDVTDEVIVKRQQQQLASLVENSGDAMAIYGLDGRVMYVNDSCSKLIGLADKADASRLMYNDFYSLAEFKKVAPQLRYALQTLGKWSGNSALRHFITGEDIPCYIHVIKITDPHTGKIVAHGMSARDMRPEIEASQALQDSRERLALSLEAANMGTFDWLLAENRLTWDARCRQLFGIEDGKDVTYASTFLNGLHPDDRAATEAEVVKAFSTNSDGSYTARYRTVSPKGEFLYWVDAAGQAYFDEARKPIRLVGTVIDVTDEVNAQQEIAEREARFRLLSNVVGQMVWVADTSRQLIYLNKSGYNYTGLTDAELDIDSWQRLIHPDDKDEYLKHWQNLLVTGDEMQFEHRLRKKNGEYRWFLTRISAHKDGKQVWVNSSTDIQLIKESEEKKNDFFQMASHELKTPVTSVKAYSQFLQKQFEKRQDKAASGMLQKMNSQISKLEVLINDLLDINRIESGKMRFNEDHFHLNDLAKEVVEEVQRTTDKHIHLTLAPMEDTLVWGDHYRIGQVLTNLLSNAIKYSPGSNKVEVKIWLENEHVHCCVSDFGIGIPYEQQEHLFNRFYRVTGQNTDTFPGLGLGLYISAEIMKRQNGSIQVKSQPQVGSDFCFSLPLFKK